MAAGWTRRRIAVSVVYVVVMSNAAPAKAGLPSLKGRPTMYPRSIRALQADALFASALQPSDQLSASQIRQAIAVALDAYGDAGCAGRVAQEFGDHPETAVGRMRWARASTAALDRQPGPRIRRVPTAGGSVRGRNVAAELPAIA